ncbi:MAG TPA: hypothetical protein V6C57_24300, partial [Coleofasciculaceae cyanobacterium]
PLPTGNEVQQNDRSQQQVNQSQPGLHPLMLSNLNQSLSNHPPIPIEISSTDQLTNGFSIHEFGLDQLTANQFTASTSPSTQPSGELVIGGLIASRKSIPSSDEAPDPATSSGALAPSSNEAPNPATPPESTQSSEESPESPTDGADSPAEGTEPSPAPRWRFSFEPYGYIPVSVDGNVSIGNFSTNIDRNTSVQDVISKLSSTLNFGFIGRAEAWREHLGFIVDAFYLNLGQNNTATRDVPCCFQNIIPSRIDTDITVSYGQFDLGAGYRFANGNLATAATEFDAGPVIFDVIAGMRIYTLSQNIDISTNLGTNRELGRSATFVTPLLSSRLRWNLSHRWALGARADFAGFGVSGLNLAWSATAGVEWMFSGNTSALLGYRFSSIDYNRNELGVDLQFHGPYLGIKFRF